MERTLLFSLDPTRPEVGGHLAAGGVVVTLADVDGRETIAIRGPGCDAEVLAVASIPATFDGKVRHNVANALAAAAIAWGMGVPVETIAAGLGAFSASLEHSRGRFNFIEGLPARVLFDYAANPPALARAVEALEHFPAAGRRICAVTSAGNRPDSQFVDCADIVARHFDRFICFDLVHYRRGRAPGEIAERLAAALVAAGVAKDRVSVSLTEDEAMVAAANMAEPDDLLIILGSEVRTSLPMLRAAFAARGTPAA